VLPASQNPAVKREISAFLARTNVRVAEDEGPDAIKLLAANHASGILLSSGNILVAREVYENDLKLLGISRHEGIEAIMQILADEQGRGKSTKYQGIKELILKYFPPVRDNLIRHYPMDDYRNFSTELYVNHVVAKAFQWLTLLRDGIILRRDIPDEEKDFIDAMEPIVDANKHNYFTGEFWNSRIRGNRVKAALNEGMRFYQTASRAEKVKQLIESLKDDSSFIRECTVENLGEIGPAAKEAVPALIKMLRDEDQKVVTATREALVKIGKPAIPALMKLLQSRSKYRHILIDAAAVVLGKIGPAAKEAVPALIRKLRDRDRDVVVAAAEALVKIGKPAIPALIKVVQSERLDEIERIYAARALGNVGPAAKKAIPILIKVFEEGGDVWDCRGREAFIEALGKIVSTENKNVVSVLIKALLKDEDMFVRRAAVKALVNIGPAAKKAVPALMETLIYVDAYDPNDKLKAEIRMNAAIALGKIGPAAKKAVPALIKALSDPYDYLLGRDEIQVSPAAAEALIKIGNPAALDLVEAFEHEEDESVRYKIRRALSEIGVKGSAANRVLPILIRDFEIAEESSSIRQEIAKTISRTGPVTDVKLLPDLMDLIKWHSKDVSSMALKSIASIAISAEKGCLSENDWKTIIERAKISSLLYILEKYPEFFNQQTKWANAAKRLVQQIQKEANNYPRDQQESFRRQICDSIDGYIVPRKNPAATIAEYYEILAFLEIVHDNLPLCLNSFRKINLKAKYFTSLRQALPLNNPLTRIIRMLGESKAVIGGFRDVTKKVQKAKSFGRLYDIIVDIAERRQRAASQEVAGLLEVLRNSKDISGWKTSDWSRLNGQIERYYSSGFKVLTCNLFKYFTEHENDPMVLSTMREDIQQQLGNIAWGGFMGFTDEFKKKYGISTEDELALLAKYMPVSNLTARDYSTKYEEVKKVLAQRADSRRDEVDKNLRKIFVFSGTKSIIAYQPEGKDRIDRDKLHRRLLDYLAKDIQDPLKTIERYILGLGRVGIEDVKRCAIVFAVENSQLERNYCAEMPQNEENIQSWLTRWHTLIADAYKHDALDRIRQLVRGAVEKIDEKRLNELLSENRIPEFISIKDKRKLLREDNDMTGVLTDEKTSLSQKQKKLSDIFLKKWMILIKTDEINDQALISSWINRGIDRFSRKLFDKAKKKNPSLKPTRQEVKGIVEKALLDAGRAAEAKVKQKTDLDRKRPMLADRISQKFFALFAPDIFEIEKELRGFKTVEREVAQGFYTGFFDDLLHLMGFMMTGVCTWDERDKQVADAKYHFGKIALKDSSGRILGLSQVQLLKSGIQGRPRKKGSKGWRVIALPGTNLYQGNIGMEKERAMLAIFETAQRLAEELDMEGAVLPVDPNIHSNYPFEKSTISQLVSKGWLKKVTLNEEVKVTPTRYPYKGVYLIDIPKKAMFLTASSAEDRVREEQLETERLQEKAIFVKEGLAEIIYGKEIPESVATSLKKEVESLISSMPQGLLEDIHLNASIKNIVLRIRIEPDAETSHVNKADAEIELMVGRDILYDESKVETVTLGYMLSELFAAFILDDYTKFKENAPTNENAYYKLEIIKSLLSYRNYLAIYHKTMNKSTWTKEKYLSEKTPEEIKTLSARYNADLDGFTTGWKKIGQYNIFFVATNDNDPDFLLANYLHLLFGREFITEENVSRLIYEISGVDIWDKPSLAALRNCLKDFVLPGKVHITVGERRQEKEKFDHFDNTQVSTELKTALLITENRNEFYIGLRTLLELTLPLTMQDINDEMTRLIDKDIFSSQNREEAIRDTIFEIFRRRIGETALVRLREQLVDKWSGWVPYIGIDHHDLPEGGNADDYGFLKYVSEDGIDYNLVFQSGENAEEPPEIHDWVEDLFKMRPSEKRSEDKNLSRGKVSEITETHPALDKAANEGRMFAVTPDQVDKMRDMDEEALVDLFAGNLVNLRALSETRNKLLEKLNDPIFRENLLKGFQLMRESIKNQSLPQDQPTRLCIMMENEDFPAIVYKDQYNSLLAHSGSGEKTNTPYTSIYAGYNSLQTAINTRQEDAFLELITHETRDVIRGKHIDEEIEKVAKLYDGTLDVYDVGEFKALWFDVLNKFFEEGATYKIKYDASRLSPSQVSIVEEYAKQLNRKTSSEFKAIGCSSSNGSEEALINVYKEDKAGNAKGEGHVDVDIPEGYSVKQYMLRIAGMVNLALATANIEDKQSGEKAGSILGFIKRQCRLIVGSGITVPKSLSELVEFIRNLPLPEVYRMPTEKIEEYNRSARKALISA